MDLFHHLPPSRCVCVLVRTRPDEKLYAYVSGLVRRLRCFVPKQRHAECRADLNQGPGHTLKNVHKTNHQSRIPKNIKEAETHKPGRTPEESTENQQSLLNCTVSVCGGQDAVIVLNL